MHLLKLCLMLAIVCAQASVHPQSSQKGVALACKKISVWEWRLLMRKPCVHPHVSEDCSFSRVWFLFFLLLIYHTEFKHHFLGSTTGGVIRKCKLVNFTHKLLKWLYNPILFGSGLRISDISTSKNRNKYITESSFSPAIKLKMWNSDRLIDSHKVT